MNEKFSYSKAGVDIKKADAFINNIRPMLESLNTSRLLGKYGGYSGLFDLENLNVDRPVLVSSSDGVGTKLLLAKLQQKYDTIGVDLVAMCVNDIIVTGAKPLFLLDYFATGKLNVDQGREIIQGIVEGCRQADCVLIGGETAEMPDLYQEEDFDLAGFCVGIVDKNKIISGEKIRDEDVIVGIQSSGLHSNGFSLVRKIFNKEELKTELGSKLLTPTNIYVKPILKLTQKINIKGIAHITGGGIFGNIPRIIPEGLEVVIKKDSWQIPHIFKEIKKRANISYNEMFNVFNMGIGMVLIAERSDVSDIKGILKNYYDLESYEIGFLRSGVKKVIFQ